MQWGLAVGYKPHSTTVTETANPNLAIPDANYQGISSEIQIQQDGNVKNIAVNIDIEHPYIGDLRIDLVSPSGQIVRLHDNTGGRSRNIKRIYDATSTPNLNDLIGESIQDKWQLRVRDLASRDIGTLVSWSITLEY